MLLKTDLRKKMKKMVSFISKSKEETIEFGTFVSKYLFEGSVVLLTGDLGAGKTTFVKGVGIGLNVKEEINSPTFNILKCYFSKPLPLYHIDAYRLEDVASENKNIGLEEVIEGNGVCLIEWPMFIEEFLNRKDCLVINIKNINENEREITMDSENLRYSKLLNEMKVKDE